MQLPRKMSAQNVMATITRSLGNRDHKSSTGNEIRFAGDERKDKLYEPKHKRKLVRVLTVVAYVIFVSMAAILLSLYYTFIWDPKDQSVRVRIRSECATGKFPNFNTIHLIDNDTQVEKNLSPARNDTVWETNVSTPLMESVATNSSFSQITTIPVRSDNARNASRTVSTSPATQLTDETTSNVTDRIHTASPD